MTARWVRKDCLTIVSGLVVRYFWRDRMPQHLDQPEVDASRDGVSIRGRWPVMDLAELDELQDIMRAATFAFIDLREGRMPQATPRWELDDRKGLFG